jgi:hypothetical protein
MSLQRRHLLLASLLSAGGGGAASNMAWAFDPSLSSSTTTRTTARGMVGTPTTTGQSPQASPPPTTPTTTTKCLARNVFFQDLTFHIDNTKVPVACWWPASDNNNNNSVENANDPTSTLFAASYSHRISVQRIGQLLARWDFIPSFVAKDFTLVPAYNQYVYQGNFQQWEGPGK